MSEIFGINDNLCYHGAMYLDERVCAGARICVCDTVLV